MITPDALPAPLPWWRRFPFFGWIIAGLVLGLVAGKIFGEKMTEWKIVSSMVLQGLQLLATPLIFVAVTLSLLRAVISGRSGMKLGWLLITNQPEPPFRNHLNREFPQGLAEKCRNLVLIGD